VLFCLSLSITAVSSKQTLYILQTLGEGMLGEGKKSSENFSQASGIKLSEQNVYFKSYQTV